MDATLGQALALVQRADNLFLTASGTVDLLAMSRYFSASEFRHYIELCRFIRASKRASSAGAASAPSASG